MAMLHVQDLRKVFPAAKGFHKPAVDGISFRVEPGEIYGLLGPNGAGKTTTERVIAGLLMPTSGSVAVNGADVTQDSQSAKRSIGFLTANTGLYRRLTPRELLPYYGRLHQLDRIRAMKRTEELIEWLDMTEFADSPCAWLSTGQKQRTNIARALIADPPVLILDEPTLGLDVLSNQLILRFIRRERDAGKAVLLSTHYLDEAESLCDRIGLLHRGRLIAEGDMARLQAQTGCNRLTEIFMLLVDEDRVRGFMEPRARTLPQAWKTERS